MTHRFSSFDEYFSTEPRVSVRSLDLGGVVVSQLEETSNDISVASVGKDAILVSLSGSDHHRVRFGGLRREAPTAVRDVALVPGGVALESSWRVPKRPLRTLSLEFDHGLFWRFAPEVMSGPFMTGHLLPATYGPRDRLSGIALLLLREMGGETARGRLFSDSVTRLLALDIAATFWSAPSRAQNPCDRPDRRIQRALDFIEAHVGEDISMLDLAAASGLSVSVLTAQFRAATGMTPYAYVIERRVARAERLLRQSDMPIAQVALSAGFADQAHQTRTMRARRNVTPGQMRRAG